MVLDLVAGKDFHLEQQKASETVLYLVVVRVTVMVQYLGCRWEHEKVQV